MKCNKHRPPANIQVFKRSRLLLILLTPKGEATYSPSQHQDLSPKDTTSYPEALIPQLLRSRKHKELSFQCDKPLHR
jgi:hypothetical protein